MHEPLVDQIRSFVIETFLFGQRDGLQDDASFIEQGIIDSTGVLELVGWVEEQYGISVGDGELVPANFDSIQNLAVYLQAKLQPVAAR